MTTSRTDQKQFHVQITRTGPARASVFFGSFLVVGVLRRGWEDAETYRLLLRWVLSAMAYIRPSVDAQALTRAVLW